MFLAEEETSHPVLVFFFSFFLFFPGQLRAQVSQLVPENADGSKEAHQNHGIQENNIVSKPLGAFLLLVN